MEFVSKSVEETAAIAANFAEATLAKQNLNQDKALVVGLYGDLGAGKTTFMKYFAESLGIRETIQSPTFVIMKKYEIRSSSNEIRNDPNSFLVTRNSDFERLIHIDAYRIEKEEEMLNLGWQEIISDPKNIICVEWPERIAGIMPQHTKIFFEHLAAENERRIKIIV